MTRVFKLNQTGSAMLQTMVALSILALTSGVILSLLTNMHKTSALEDLQIDAANFRKLAINNLAMTDRCTPEFIKPVAGTSALGANMDIESVAGSTRQFQIKLPFYNNWMPTYQSGLVDLNQSAVSDMNMAVEKVDFIQDATPVVEAAGDRTVTGILKFSGKSTKSSLASPVTRDIVTLKVTMDSFTGAFKSCYSYMSPEALCTSLGGKLIGRCMFQYRDLECPRGQYITSMDPDGTIHCTNGTITCGNDVFIGIRDGKPFCRPVTFTKILPVMPEILGHPQGFTAPVGTTGQSMYVLAKGLSDGSAGTLTYRWQKNGVDVDPEGSGGCVSTGSNGCHFPNLRAIDAGDYTVVVSNSVGTVVSNVASVRIGPYIPPPAPGLLPADIYFTLTESTVREKSDYPSFDMNNWDPAWDTYDWTEPTHTIQVTMSQVQTSAVAVNLKLGDGTADINDFSIDTYSLVIPAGQTTAQVTLSIKFDFSGDDYDEPEEVANFKIVSATAGLTILPDKSTHALHIQPPAEQVPNDFDWRGYPYVYFADAGGVAEEGTTHQVVAKVNQLVPGGFSMNVSPSTSNTAARCGSSPCDYNMPSTLNFAPNARSASFGIVVVNDGISDGNELLIVNPLTFASGATSIYGSGTYTVTIQDAPPTP